MNSGRVINYVLHFRASAVDTDRGGTARHSHAASGSRARQGRLSRDRCNPSGKADLNLAEPKDCNLSPKYSQQQLAYRARLELRQNYLGRSGADTCSSYYG